MVQEEERGTTHHQKGDSLSQKGRPTGSPGRISAPLRGDNTHKNKEGGIKPQLVDSGGGAPKRTNLTGEGVGEGAKGGANEGQVGERTMGSKGSGGKALPELVCWEGAGESEEGTNGESSKGWRAYSPSVVP